MAEPRIPDSVCSIKVFRNVEAYHLLYYTLGTRVLKPSHVEDQVVPYDELLSVEQLLFTFLDCHCRESSNVDVYQSTFNLKNRLH